MPAEALYGELACYYDAIYHQKDYVAEADALHARLQFMGIPGGARILDAGCGTGAHLVALSRFYEVDGFDKSPAMVALARIKAPRAHLFEADLASFAVDRPYDAALCMFSSIGYLSSAAALEASARCFAAAVRPGGVLLIEPWLTVEHWEVGRPDVETFQTPDLALARAAVAAIRGDIAVVEMHWLIAERGRPVRHVVDLHEMWLCPHEVLKSAFDVAGFDVSLEPGGPHDRGLLVGRRRGPSAGA